MWYFGGVKKIDTFLSQNPLLFDVYYDRIKPKTDPVKFLHVSDQLQRILDRNERVYAENEPLIVATLCKLLMMSKDNVVSADKLVHVKREFGFPSDVLVNLVPKYPEYFKLVGDPGEGNSFLQLVSWNPRFAKSVIEQRADEESELTSIKIRPSFNWKVPSGFLMRKELREWIRDWKERPYISPYDNASNLNQASLETEKRTVGVFHELLSLSLYKRIPVPILGKFTEEYRFSNAFSSVFPRHSRNFYMSLKGGIKTAMLREAYKGDQLINRDPLLEVNDNFIELLAKGHKQREEELNLKKQAVKKDMDMVLVTNSTLNDLDLSESEELYSS
ncbi:putative plant organelle RNA recognition domain-containing protein [Helianthus annuus]|nr:putative plant organelle RNA recognition domain-containing protein [Helianthus annuus]KAJ0932314.1 putative plant organelle RNA recognition domain-containing protein [Helianthus annuus]